jgi:hypothetical protein
MLTVPSGAADAALVNNKAAAARRIVAAVLMKDLPKIEVRMMVFLSFICRRRS